MWDGKIEKVYNKTDDYKSNGIQVYSQGESRVGELIFLLGLFQ